MAGGKGERFWPLSSESRPKQLLPLTSDKSMLSVTIDRVGQFIPPERIVIVAGANISRAILDGCPLLNEGNLLAEPVGRNTCLAIGYAAVHLLKRDPEAIMVVLSADHLIEPAGKMIDVFKAGVKLASEDNHLITIGIVPTRAETGYGYIELGDEQWQVEGVTVCRVAAFKEKPRPVVAQQYYHDRRHLWNSGMFIWSAKTILEAMLYCQPEMHAQLLEYAGHIGTANEEKAREKLYNEAEPISIDYAVLEEADNVLTLKGDFLWDDVGSWLSLQRFKPTDRDNNVIVGRAVTLDTFESTLYNTGDGLIAAVGLSDVVIAKVGDIVLAAHKTQLGQLKELLAAMAADEDLKKYL
jgi:mannose-1-phosphate guanylyltransferase